MRVRDVDSLWNEFAVPELKKAGFRRRGRQYAAEGPQNRRAVLDFIPQVTGGIGSFEVVFGVTTAEHVRFLEDQGFPPGEWPLPSDALLRGKVLSPDFARTGAPWRVPDTEWILGSSDHNAEIGVALRSALGGDMLPRIHSWFEPRGLLKDLKSRLPGTFPGLVPIERAIGMALLEVEGSTERLAQTLEVLPSDDFVRTWIERRSAELSRS